MDLIFYPQKHYVRISRTSFEVGLIERCAIASMFSEVSLLQIDLRLLSVNILKAIHKYFILSDTHTSGN